MRNSDVFIAERKKKVIQAFCAPGPAQHKVDKAAMEAASNEKELREVFAQLCKKPFAASLEIFDVNKPFLAATCRELLKNSKCKPAEKIMLVKLLLKTMGEATEEQATTVNVNTPKALVLVGARSKQVNAMLDPQQFAELPASAAELPEATSDVVETPER